MSQQDAAPLLETGPIIDSPEEAPSAERPQKSEKKK
jgi:hypothetical protein